MAARLAKLTPPDVLGDLAWNPEFLREGFAVPDTLRPSRVWWGPLGDDAALEYMYTALVAADRSQAARDAVAASISAAVTCPSSGSYLSDELSGLGYSGASQVARVVRQAVLAPLPRPWRQARLGPTKGS